MKKRFTMLLALVAMIVLLPGAFSNPWLNQTQWWIDESNISTVALDSNTCATQSAPCRTMREVIRRLGGPYASLLTSGVAFKFHFMSTNAALGHQIQFTPFCGDNTLIAFEGVLTQVGSSCTLTSVTNRNTSGSVGTQMSINATCPTAVGQLITNATHPSTAYVKSGTSPNWVLTQAESPCDVATNTCNRVMVNNWANGDTISVWTMPAIETDITGCVNPAQSSGAFGYTHIGFSGGGNNIIGSYPAVWEDTQVASAIVRVAGLWPELENYFMQPSSGSLIAWTPYPANLNVQFKGTVPSIEGGLFRQNADLQGFAFDLGVDLENGSSVAGTYGDVYLGPAGTDTGIYIEPGPQNMMNAVGNHLIWGPGSFNLMPGAALGCFPGQCAGDFVNGAVAAGGTGYAFYPGNANVISATALWCATNTAGTTSVATNCGISGIGSNIELAFGSGGCGGACWYPNGSSVSTFKLQ